jgi:uncharacterized membrane protein YecN with MAPEG domain
MEYVAIVTILLLVQYIAFQMMTGKARETGGVPAPAVSGDEGFERMYRVQMNTLENLIITLPAMFLCAHYFNSTVAAALGAVFFVGRILYLMSYRSDPKKRGPGFILGFLANIGLLGCSLYGIIF